MKCPFIIKICSECKKILIANKINFCKKKDGKWGLSSRCKECDKKRNKKYYNDNKEEILEQKKQYYNDNKEERDEMLNRAGSSIALTKALCQARDL